MQKFVIRFYITENSKNPCYEFLWDEKLKNIPIKFYNKNQIVKNAKGRIKKAEHFLKTFRKTSFLILYKDYFYADKIQSAYTSVYFFVKNIVTVIKYNGTLITDGYDGYNNLEGINRAEC